MSRPPSHFHPPSCSSQLAAHLPNITILLEQLAYGDKTLDRYSVFTNHLRNFRKDHQVEGGTHAQDWTSPTYQDALMKMSSSFLDEGGYGEVYWPSDHLAANFNSLRYSIDRTL
jgi:hypothetical protein